MTVQEILKQTGFSDEEIKAMNEKAITAFTTVLSTAATSEANAAKAKEEAEIAQRAQEAVYRDQIAPALDNWATEKANMEASVEFYRKQNESARASGFIPKDAPNYKPAGDGGGGGGEGARDSDGRFVAGANRVPGSPAYLTMDQGIRALSNAHWADAEYFRLFREPIPDDLETLLKESVARHMDFREHVEQKYGFKAKREAMAAAKQKEHDDNIVKETETRVRKEIAEKNGSNPNVRSAQPSQFSTINKGVSAGTRKDPLMMTESERHANTRAHILTEIAENESQRVN